MEDFRLLIVLGRDFNQHTSATFRALREIRQKHTKFTSKEVNLVCFSKIYNICNFLILKCTIIRN